MGIFGLLSVAMFLILPVFYLTNHKFRYFMKFVTYYSICMFTGVWVAPYAYYRDYKKPRDIAVLRKVASFWNFMFRIYNVEVEIRNQHYLETDSCSVIMSNHQSSIDMIPMFQTIPKSIRPSALAKKELMYMGTFGWGAYLCGLVFVDRLNPDKARSTMDRAVKQIQDERINLWVFPEGTRHQGSEMLEFKKGGFHLAVQAQCPICPVVFTSYRHFLDKKRWIFNPGKVIATCMPPIPTKGLTRDDVNDLVNKTRDQMMDVWRKTSEEVEAWAAKNGRSLLIENKAAAAS